MIRVVDPAERLGVLIIEDHAVLAQGLGVALRAIGYRTHVVVPAGGRDAILAEAATFGPDVVLLDLHLGGDTGDSYGLIRPLSGEGAAVVVLTGEEDPAPLGRCLEAGAAGVLRKTESLDEVSDAVARAANGESVISVRGSQDLLAALSIRRAETSARLAPFATLTRREQEVLAHLIGGHSAESVASSCFVAVATVRSQIRAILRKLRVSSQLQAVALAREAGWSLPDPQPGEFPDGADR